MKKVLLLAVVAISSLMASDGETDFLQRLVNFIIFAAILYYLLADKARAFFNSRKEAIANEFQSIQDKLRESKQKKDNLKTEVENAHKKAEEIVKTAKEEAKFIKAKVEKSTSNDIENLNKQFEDFKSSEERKMKREVVKEYMDEVTKEVHIDSQEAVNIVSKKVVA
jgi:F-type H+-transporting ATPase subunit b